MRFRDTSPILGDLNRLARRGAAGLIGRSEMKNVLFSVSKFYRLSRNRRRRIGRRCANGREAGSPIRGHSPLLRRSAGTGRSLVAQPADCAGGPRDDGADARVPVFRADILARIRAVGGASYRARPKTPIRHQVLPLARRRRFILSLMEHV